MALSTTSYNVLLHPGYIDLQENVYQNTGQEGYGSLPLRDREVLEGQVIAMIPGYFGEGVPYVAYPDAAGMSKDPHFLADWMSKARWVINQRKASLERTGQLMDVTIVPSVRESMLHTGSEPLKVGDYVYVRFPTDADVEAQRSALSDSFGGLSTGNRPCPPMFATYGVTPGSIDSRARIFESMDRYKRYLTSNNTDFATSSDGEEGTIAQIESSKVAFVTRLLALVVKQLNVSPLGDDLKKLAESIEPDAAGEDSALSKCRESNLFKTSQGVAFTSRFLATLKQNDFEMYQPRPIGEVLQSLEPGNHSCILTGHKVAINLFLQ